MTGERLEQVMQESMKQFWTAPPQSLKEAREQFQKDVQELKKDIMGDMGNMKFDKLNMLSADALNFVGMSALGFNPLSEDDVKNVMLAMKTASQVEEVKEALEGVDFIKVKVYKEDIEELAKAMQCFDLIVQSHKSQNPIGIFRFFKDNGTKFIGLMEILNNISFEDFVAIVTQGIQPNEDKKFSIDLSKKNTETQDVFTGNDETEPCEDCSVEPTVTFEYGEVVKIKKNNSYGVVLENTQTHLILQVAGEYESRDFFGNIEVSVDDVEKVTDINEKIVGQLMVESEVGSVIELFDINEDFIKEVKIIKFGQSFALIDENDEFMADSINATLVNLYYYIATQLVPYSVEVA